MTVSKPTIVLVHGALHGHTAFDPVLPLLHAADYITTAVSLPSVGASPGHTDFTTDVAAVRATVGGLNALGRETVLVAHSYGGTIISEAARGLSRTERERQGNPGGVVKLIYIASVLPKLGASVTQTLRETSGDGELPAKQVVDHGNGTHSITNGEEIFYHDISPELAKYYAGLLRPQSLGVFTSPLTYDAYNHIPSAYLICAQDKALPLRFQKKNVKELGIETTKIIDTSHSPFLSQPQVVVDFIREFVE